MESNAKKSGSSAASLSPMKALKEVTYNPRLQAAARALHLTNVLRRCYQWATGGNHNILRVNLGRFDVLFHTHSAGEYRFIEHHFMGSEMDFLNELMTSLGEGDAFLDVGSHIGQFAVPIAKMIGIRGLVIAVEPVPSACVALEGNLKLNGLSNVRILRTALGDECKEGRLAWTEGTCPSLLRASTQDQETVKTTAPSLAGGLEVVSVEVGDQLMDGEALPIPKAVKIDVEGYELQVIRGLSRTLRNPSCRLLCCEIHPALLPSGTTPQVVIEEVKTLGFTDMVLRKRFEQIHMLAHKDRRQA